MFNLKNDVNAVQQQIGQLSNNNIGGIPLSDFIFDKIITRVDPIQYCERVLRAHLPDNKRHLHENQTELIRAVANPRIRKVAALMAKICWPSY